MEPSSVSSTAPPPILDFSAFRGSDLAARDRLASDIVQACRDKGFFQLTNTNISLDLQKRIMGASRDFFALPLEEKMNCDLKKSKAHRGYEPIRAQNLEPGAAPDTKESIYIGEEMVEDDPRVLKGYYNCGPNQYPESLGKPFQDTCTEYWAAASELAKDVMRAIALGMGIGEDWFDEFINTNATSTVRLVHYPPTPRDNPKERGVGAHRDFGCVTILLQDDVGGLQVQDEWTGEWLNVAPVAGAFVVNLGNAMMRWSNHHLSSNTHRVMNFSDRDRYSVPMFFNSNAETIMDVLPGCETRKDTSDRIYGPPLKAGTYSPVKLRDFLNEQFTSSYSRASTILAA